MNHSSRSDSDSIDHKISMADYNFENLIYQAKEDCDEDCELLEELARLLQQ